MGEVIATARLMPKGPDVDLEQMKIDVKKIVSKYAELHKLYEEPIAFGLIALNVMFIIDDNAGGTQLIDEKLAKLANVNSVKVVDVRRLM